MNKSDNQSSAQDSHYARLRRKHRDSKSVANSNGETLVLYGMHTVSQALNNSNRAILSLYATRNGLNRLGLAQDAALPFPVHTVSPRDLDKMVAPDAVHQGVLVVTRPLHTKRLEDLADTPLVLVLDQVTDPHNVGAIMRSAVAMDCGALITTYRHSPTESGVLAKAASGALECINHIEVRNLAEAIETLQNIGFYTIGLDSEADAGIEHSMQGNKLALVLGAEGRGLRQKTRATVNALARLDMPGQIKSLNVSNAAAISLYAAHRHFVGQKS